MKNLLLAVLMLLPLSINAQLLYRVSRSDIPTDSYILGTHHLTPYKFTKNITGFDSAFNSCEKVYGEIKLDKKTTKALNAKLMPLMMMPQDTLFSDLVTREEYEYIDSELRRYLGDKFSLDKMSQFKPATISMQIEMMLAMQDENGKLKLITHPIDAEIQDKAKRSDKQILGLESADSQISLLFGDSLNEQADALLRTLRAGDLRQENRKLTALYEAQDSEGLYEYIINSMAQAAESGEDAEKYLEEMLFSRNEKWADILLQAMQEGATFVAVGAGHLHGQRGLIKLLEDKGFTITAVE